MASLSGFDRYVAIDWTGARGVIHKGLAVAEALAGNAPPRLVAPPGGKYWSREGVQAYLRQTARAGERVMAGIDCSFSLPFPPDQGFFPGVEGAPQNARALWALTEQISAAAADLYAGPFVQHPDFGRYFWHPGGVGDMFRSALRVTEQHCATQKHGRAICTFLLVGATQVGLGSLSGMRLLHELSRQGGGPAIWPFDEIGGKNLVLVEIYTRLFLRMAGFPNRKIRNHDELMIALNKLGIGSAGEAYGVGPLDDHTTDALVSAAGMRALVQSGTPGLWTPRGLTGQVSETEGWTFGVR